MVMVRLPASLEAASLPSKRTTDALFSSTFMKNSVPSTAALTNGVLILRLRGLWLKKLIAPVRKSTRAVSLFSMPAMVTIVFSSRRRTESLGRTRAARLSAMTRMVTPSQYVSYNSTGVHCDWPAFLACTVPCTDSMRITHSSQVCTASASKAPPIARRKNEIQIDRTTLHFKETLLIPVFQSPSPKSPVRKAPKKNRPRPSPLHHLSSRQTTPFHGASCRRSISWRHLVM